MKGFEDIQKFLKELEIDITQYPEKYFDIELEEDMQILDKETEELLSEILADDKNFPNVLQLQFAK